MNIRERISLVSSRLFGGAADRATALPFVRQRVSRQMDGIIADLPGICDLADEYDALVMVDDSHAVVLARDIAKQIEDEMEYPGQIRVMVIRESRSVEYAK